mgnify:CR=1 FL=1
MMISIIKLNNYIENNLPRRIFKKILTVYRGQSVSKEEFDNIQKTLGGFILFNNFLSTNKNKEISLDFARYTLSNADIVSVLFIITVNPSKSTSSFATIDKAAYLGDEDEIIFVMHTIFRIQKIQPIDENSRLFQVELELTHKNDEELHALTNHIHKETFPNSREWFRLGEVFSEIGQFDKAQEVYEILLKQQTEEVKKAPIYHQLGLLKDDQEEYKESIKFYEQAVNIAEKSSSSSDDSNFESYKYNFERMKKKNAMCASRRKFCFLVVNKIMYYLKKYR